jgi:hypothetical protein
VQITAVENYEIKKTATSGKLIMALYASYVYVSICCTCLSGRLECNSLFVGMGDWGVRGNERKIWFKSVVENGDGLNV